MLRKIGSFHTSFSAGLVIGGKDVKAEQLRLGKINILVATPGRLLQHMDQTPDFDTSNLQVLVLDEADRCLDMGFEKTLNAILENLPKARKGQGELTGRQTLLFSATQTKKVKDLARLSLDEPEYVAVKAGPHGSVEDLVSGKTLSDRQQGDDGDAQQGRRQLLPKQLEQHYMLVSLDRKLDMLYSFIRTHPQAKLLVFLSSCRQVQFVFESFCKLRPGIPLLSLHGKQKQAKRLQIYSEFSKMKHACLIATDIAARGLDFPSVDWVVQVDAPEDAETYVHRVGRTARYDKAGNSLLFLLESEKEGMLAKLKEKGIEEGSTINLIKAKESKLQSIANQLQSFLFQDAQLKYLGQKAFVSYVRSLHLQKDKKTFDVTLLPLEKFADALGLPGAPKVKFVKEAKKEKAKREKMEKKAEKAKKSAEEGVLEEEEQVDGKNKVRTKYDRMFERKNEGVLTDHYQKLVAEDDGSEEDVASEEEEEEEEDLLGGDDDDSEEETAFQTVHNDDGDDFLTLKRHNHGLSDESDDEEEAGQDGPSTSAAGARDAAIQKRLEREAKEAAASNLSKRQLKVGKSKKAMAAAGKRGQGDKLVFDDEGVPHALYELKGEDEFRAAGDATEQQKEFERKEKELLQASDVLDKERMKEKRREKKRKMKERERQANGEDVSDEEEEGVQLAPLDEDDDYEEPDWLLPEELWPDDDDDDDEDDERPAPPPAKRSKTCKRQNNAGDATNGSLAADEELALRLLSGGA